MLHSAVLQRYLKGFACADQDWGSTVARVDEHLAWWQALPWQADQTLAWTQLCSALPQLCLPQETNISHSDLYRERVLRGVLCGSNNQSEEQPIQDMAELRLLFTQHPFVSMPVLSTPNRTDFEWLVRALAHRGEPVAIESSVHAQAISGLIHWGLIRMLGNQQRASLIVLHEAPYSSIPAEQAPGGLDHREWLRISGALRLEHELTHLTTKQQLGEMRINLLDELVADTMGQLVALGGFNADLFCRCMLQRWRSYVPDLNPTEAHHVLDLVLTRAQELEPALSAWCGDAAVADRGRLLQWLCRLRLDQPICTPAPQPLGTVHKS